jgi:predicted nuclease with TOPRIM domain
MNNKPAFIGIGPPGTLECLSDQLQKLEDENSGLNDKLERAEDQTSALQAAQKQDKEVILTQKSTIIEEWTTIYRCQQDIQQWMLVHYQLSYTHCSDALEHTISFL